MYQQALYSIENKLRQEFDIAKEQESMGPSDIGDGHFVFLFEEDMRVKIEAGTNGVGFEVTKTENRMMGDDIHQRIVAEAKYNIHDVPDAVDKVADHLIDVLRSLSNAEE